MNINYQGQATAKTYPKQNGSRRTLRLACLRYAFRSEPSFAPRRLRCARLDPVVRPVASHDRSDRRRHACWRSTLLVSVAYVVNLVANGMTPAEIVAKYPELEEEDVRQALGYAAAVAEDQVCPLPAGK
jgi:uncharacterized protein (DUF433 family)